MSSRPSQREGGRWVPCGDMLCRNKSCCLGRKGNILNQVHVCLQQTASAQHSAQLYLCHRRQKTPNGSLGNWKLGPFGMTGLKTALAIGSFGPCSAFGAQDTTRRLEGLRCCKYTLWTVRASTGTTGRQHHTHLTGAGIPAYIFKLKITSLT